MASIGELFKFLGANESFLSLCQDIQKTNQQIIENAFQNEELITSLRNIVQDDNIIKAKMEIIIGQKKKGQPKKQEQSKKQEQIQEDTKIVEELVDFKYKPINPSKVVYLGNFAYVEPVDYRVRLVTHDYELYY